MSNSDKFPTVPESQETEAGGPKRWKRRVQKFHDESESENFLKSVNTYSVGSKYTVAAKKNYLPLFVLNFPSTRLELKEFFIKFWA